MPHAGGRTDSALGRPPPPCSARLDSSQMLPPARRPQVSLSPRPSALGFAPGPVAAVAAAELGASAAITSPTTTTTTTTTIGQQGAHLQPAAHGATRMVSRGCQDTSEPGGCPGSRRALRLFIVSRETTCRSRLSAWPRPPLGARQSTHKAPSVPRTLLPYLTPPAVLGGWLGTGWGDLPARRHGPAVMQGAVCSSEHGVVVGGGWGGCAAAHVRRCGRCRTGDDVAPSTPLRVRLCAAQTAPPCAALCPQ
jgi:hypothetical protein